MSETIRYVDLPHYAQSWKTLAGDKVSEDLMKEIDLLPPDQFCHLPEGEEIVVPKRSLVFIVHGEKGGRCVTQSYFCADEATVTGPALVAVESEKEYQDRTKRVVDIDKHLQKFSLNGDFWLLLVLGAALGTVLVSQIYFSGSESFFSPKEKDLLKVLLFGLAFPLLFLHFMLGFSKWHAGGLFKKNISTAFPGMLARALNLDYARKGVYDLSASLNRLFPNPYMEKLRDKTASTSFQVSEAIVDVTLGKAMKEVVFLGDGEVREVPPGHIVSIWSEGNTSSCANKLGSWRHVYCEKVAFLEGPLMVGITPLTESEIEERGISKKQMQRFFCRRWMLLFGLILGIFGSSFLYHSFSEYLPHFAEKAFQMLVLFAIIAVFLTLFSFFLVRKQKVGSAYL